MTYAAFMVPTDHNFFDEVEEAIEAAQGSGRKVVFAPDFFVTGQFALYRNHLLFGSTSPYALVANPAALIETTRRAIAEGDEADYDHAMTLEEVGALGRVADQFFDPYHFRYVAPELGFNDIARAGCFGAHGAEALKLENSRAAGKAAMHAAGVIVTPYVVITKPDEIELLDTLDTERFFLKYDKQAIGAYSLAGAKEALPSLLVNGPVVAEKFIGSRSTEVSFSYFVVGENVQPLYTLLESNRLLDNDSGAKIGAACTYHDGTRTLYPDEMKLTGEAIAEVGRKLLAAGDGFNGWVDVSFVIDDDGDWFFTEWMVRCGVPNISTQLHQMRVSYFDLWATVQRGETLTPDALWRTPYSYGVSLYNLPIGWTEQEGESIITLNPELLNPNNPVVIDPVGGSAALFNGRDLFVPNSCHCFAVLSCNSAEPIAGNFDDENRYSFPLSVVAAMKPYLRELAGQIPALAWRSFTV